MGMIQRREAETKNLNDAFALPISTEVPVESLGVKEPSDPKDRRISRAGIWQAVASNPALISYAADLDALKTVIRELADDGIKYINGK